MEKTATLIHWAEGIDQERIDRWIEKMKEAGFIDSSNTQDYNPDETAPTLYFV